MNPFFTPAGGITGDTFPFFHDGVWHLFHMCMPSIAHHVSRDLVHWERRPDAVGRGPAGSADEHNNATGCVVAHAGLFHLFYTGNQNICHAVSNDLDHWTKDDANPVLRPDERYDQANFRDPFVFWNREETCWWMLVATRRVDAPCLMRGGAVAMATSPDLQHWTMQDPLHRCESGPFIDCPQLVHEAGRWWLFTLPYQTRVRVGDSPRGPFQRPARRDLETPAANAGSRSASDGRRRISWPFLTRMEGDRDLGDFVYGGCLCLPRELTFGPDGVSQRLAPEMAAALRALPDPGDPLAGARVLSGDWDLEHAIAQCTGDGGGAVLLPTVAVDCMLDAEVALDGARQDACLLFRTSADLRRGYQLELSADTGLASVRRFNEWDVGRVLAHRPGAVPNRRPFRVQLVICGSACEIIIDGTSFLTLRCHDFSDGFVGLEVRDGPGIWSDLAWRPLAADGCSQMGAGG